MKLFEKYNRLNITASILIFIIGSITFYILLDYILIRQLDDTLLSEQQEIMAYAKTHNALPEMISTPDQHISTSPAAAGGATTVRTVKNRYDKEEEYLREINFTVSAGGKYHNVTVDKPLEETESLLQVIIGVTILMIAMILLAGYLINRTVIRKLWKPFYTTIDQVKQYRLADRDAALPVETPIEEFSLMNSTINEMITRIQRDYESLQQFTGQAAHEMQTPLAIIQSKLDTIVQNESLLERNGQHIADIENAVSRLSRLHRSLLLLTKVENRQFELNEEVLLNNVISEKFSEYAELAENRQLTISLQLQPILIRFHRHLADIVIGNLVNNAIRYNIPGGEINVVAVNNTISIANTSAGGPLDRDKIFKRFYRGQSVDEGNGLGLSIVWQICDMAGYTISYSYHSDRHEFTISV